MRKEVPQRMDEIEQKICRIIDGRRDELIAFGDDIWRHAELGFEEHRTAGKFAEGLRALGIPVREHIAVTGVRGEIGSADRGPTVCLMGELDALPIPDCPAANPETGAAHCCGHNAQLTGVLGAAMALTDPEVRAALDGRVVLFGVPAEEYVEVDRRNEMRDQGLIRYGCGKCELIRLGEIDDIDLVVGHHASTTKKYLVANRSCNGVITKLVRFTGRAAHAAGEPQRGVDAMAAAQIALHAVDVQRESFRDQDAIRVHGAFTKIAGASNVICDETRLEFLVRGKTIPAYMDAAKKVDRALRAGAVATGCGVEIRTLPGSLPIVPVKDASVMDEVLHLVCGDTPVTCTGPDFHATSSGDYGDISCIRPLLQFNTGGFRGAFHTPDVEVDDLDDAYVIPAKVFALAAYRLLRDGAARTRQIVREFEPTMTKAQYLDLMESMLTVETVEPNPLPLLDAASVV